MVDGFTPLTRETSTKGLAPAKPTGLSGLRYVLSRMGAAYFSVFHVVLPVLHDGHRPLQLAT